MIDAQKQPRALYLIVFIQMWECFSFYGMRVLLVLYMINEMQFSDGAAFGVYALYTGLVELGGIVGGIVADRLLGLRRAITLGGWLIAAGHLTLAFGEHSAIFFPALALIIVGSSLFSTNLSAILGSHYAQDDARRESGFTLFYAGINLGALLASLLCGYVGEHFGWHYGFGLAFIGMLMGNITIQLFGSLLEEKSVPTKSKTRVAFFVFSFAAVYFVSQALVHEEIFLPCLPWICVSAITFVAYNLLKFDSSGWLKLAKLGLYLMGLALFFAAEEQMGSSITLFSDRHTTKSLFNIPIPPAVLLSINPLVIILFGTLLSGFVAKLSRNRFANFPFRIVIPFTLATCAFGGLACACLFATNPLPIVLVMAILVLISLAELLIGPSVYSLCSEIASKGNQGMVMGLVPIGFSLASAIGGYLSKWMAVEEENMMHSLRIYQEGFTAIAILLAVSAVVITLSLLLLAYKGKREEVVL
jgi:POT family proton-dependent oligopeptide transporter